MNAAKAEKPGLCMCKCRRLPFHWRMAVLAEHTELIIMYVLVACCAAYRRLLISSILMAVAASKLCVSAYQRKSPLCMYSWVKLPCFYSMTPLALLWPLYLVIRLMACTAGDIKPCKLAVTMAYTALYILMLINQFKPQIFIVVIS